MPPQPPPCPEQAEALLPEMIALRRAIHAEPELGLSLPLTTAKVKQALAGLPLEFREGPSTTGLIAILTGTAPLIPAKAGISAPAVEPAPSTRRVLLRGDMDAL